MDILHNAAYLLDLFRHLGLDENGNCGGLSVDAAEAFFWLDKMLEDTLLYVSHHLKEAWDKRETHHSEEKLQQSVFIKAMREPAGGDKSQIYNIIASCLSISCADVEAFVAMIEGQQNGEPDEDSEEAESEQ